ncbi:hypothetical protein HK098_000029 [Nowakowskiella sp. JEL0407]|nr:hypothetical protein HK098_000029 [Nowakowskiella sp. JEL0407]
MTTFDDITTEEKKDTEMSDAKTETSPPEYSSTERPRVEQGGELDLVFALDCTGSMGSYIQSAFTSIESIVNQIVTSEKTNLRFGLVAYRDHPPQDSTYVTKVHPFTSKPTEMTKYIAGLSATGGGDGPEAVASALYQSFQMPWRPNATKIVIIIADAPPHGLGESGDGFPNGDPDGHDPLQIARQMSTHGITIFSVACEPALSGYRYAVDFFTAIAKMTGGMMLPLTSATLLPEVVIGGAREQIDLERRMEALRLDAEKYEKEKGGKVNEKDMLKHLHQQMLDRGEHLTQLSVENPYQQSHEAETNVANLMTYESLSTASKNLSAVKGSRLTSKFSAPSASSHSGFFGGAPPKPTTSSYSGFFGGAPPKRTTRSLFSFGGPPTSAPSAYAPPPSALLSMAPPPPGMASFGSSSMSMPMPAPTQQISISKAEVSEDQVFRMYSKMKSTASKMD